MRITQHMEAIFLAASLLACTLAWTSPAAAATAVAASVIADDTAAILQQHSGGLPVLQAV